MSDMGGAEGAYRRHADYMLSTGQWTVGDGPALNPPANSGASPVVDPDANKPEMTFGQVVTYLRTGKEGGAKPPEMSGADLARALSESGREQAWWVYKNAFGQRKRQPIGWVIEVAENTCDSDSRSNDGYRVHLLPDGRAIEVPMLRFSEKKQALTGGRPALTTYGRAHIRGIAQERPVVIRRRY